MDAWHDYVDPWPGDSSLVRMVTKVEPTNGDAFVLKTVVVTVEQTSTITTTTSPPPTVMMNSSSDDYYHNDADVKPRAWDEQPVGWTGWKEEVT